MAPWARVCGLLAVALLPAGSLLASTLVGGPAWQYGLMVRGNPVNDSGTCIGTYDFSMEGWRAIVFGPTLAAPLPLQTMGTDPDGHSYVDVYDLNAGGIAVGICRKFGPTQQDLGNRAVRWNASTGTVTELDGLDSGVAGIRYDGAEAINQYGVTVGSATRYGAGGVLLGYRPVRWDAGSTVPIELGNLGTDASGVATGFAKSINSSGTIAGYVLKYGASAQLGTRPTRWDANSTVAVELGIPGTDAAGYSYAGATKISDSGVIIQGDVIW